MFKNKKKIQELSDEINRLNNQLYINENNNIDDFISILQQIQELNNEKSQWKHRQTVINNAVNLAIENYQNKKAELDINK